MRVLTLSAILILWWSCAAAQDSCVVHGHVLGCDGKPMRSAFVRPFGPGRSGHLAAATPDGEFQVAFPRPGGYFLVFGGVHHQTLFMPLLIERPGPLELTVRLSAASYRSSFDSVQVVGDFNDYKSEGALPMSRRTDGTLIASVPCDRDTLRYQLLGVQTGTLPICGTQADTFLVDRRNPMLGNQSNSFISVLKAERKPVQVVFDPARLPRGYDEPVITFADPLRVAARIVDISQDMSRRGHRISDAFAAAKAAGRADSFHWDASPDLKSLATEIEGERATLTRANDLKSLATEIDGERATLTRAYLLLNYVHLAVYAPDSTKARRILAEIPPDSPVWSLEWGGPDKTFYDIGQMAKRPALWRDYGERVVAAHPDSSVRAAFLYDLLEEAQKSGDKERAGRYYTQLVGDYAGSQYADWSKKQYGPNRAVMVHKPCPDFALAGLEDSARVYRAADFKGKYVLIDFWATWCGPCVGELASLHRAHEKFKGRGLVILSVSFDEKRETVKRFRSGKWPMPWLHAFLPNGFASGVAAAFEIVGIPRPILIGPDGTIVAVDEDLRGEKLDGTLARALGGDAGRLGPRRALTAPSSPSATGAPRRSRAAGSRRRSRHACRAGRARPR